MSTELRSINTTRGNGDMHVTQFFGGEHDGLCIQLTQRIDGDWRYIQLTKSDARKVARRLMAWAKGTK